MFVNKIEGGIFVIKSTHNQDTYIFGLNYVKRKRREN
jgi:hypothetical protein